MYLYLFSFAIVNLRSTLDIHFETEILFKIKKFIFIIRISCSSITDLQFTFKWNLVCDGSPRRSLFSTFYFIGNYGVLLSGIMSDKLAFFKNQFVQNLLVLFNLKKKQIVNKKYFFCRFGRKFTAYSFVLANAVFNIAIAVLVSADFADTNLQQILFAILRLLTGLAMNVYAVAVVICKLSIIKNKKFNNI